MNNNPYTYNRPSVAPMTPPPTMPMRQKMMKGVRRVQDVFPRWLSLYSIVVYILALMLVSFMYSAYSLPWYYMLSGVIAVLVFFLYGGYATKTLSLDRVRKEKTFEKKIFFIALVPRVVFMLLLYWLFTENYQEAFGFEAGDAWYYHILGEFVSEQIGKGDFHFYEAIPKWNGGRDDISDMGYGIYMGFVYWMTGNSIIVVRLLKCLWSSITVLLVYRIAKRNFGEKTARVAAIFCALWPNFWYYCAVHLKETEMVFLGVLFVEQADQMLRSRQFTAWKILPILLIVAAIFTVRTPLAIVALLSLAFSVVMSSSRVVTWGKRIIIGLLAVVLIGVVAGDQLEEQASNLIEQAQSDSQKENMEWRARRDNGNVFAKYAGKSVFAPLIFTIPFPSMVRPFDGQDVLQIVNGGNFVKNIMSCFTIFAMVMLLISGQWREHLLPLSFMLGYLAVLVMSTFAQSERFHQPATPFEFMFAAYGLSIAVTKKKYKRWFTYWCILMFVACIAWNWFKMAGRGLA